MYQTYLFDCIFLFLEGDIPTEREINILEYVNDTNVNISIERDILHEINILEHIDTNVGRPIENVNNNLQNDSVSQSNTGT